MSNVYISEPPTTGHVILTTNTYGSIDIHLYCKECPTITKYFLQLCTHEYYNNVLFHRILSNLLIQTGLVRYTGDNSNNSNSSNNNNYSQATTSERQRMMEYNKVIHANESYERSKYEIHSRIRFNHRGQVAMALPIDNDHNNNHNTIAEEIQEMQPQFFITTDEAPYLNGKHVIFGTVVGPTIFNVIRINQYCGLGSGVDNDDDKSNNTQIVDTNDSSAPRIISTKIITNPFEQSMIPKSLVLIPWLQLSKTDETTAFNSNNSTNNLKKKKRKGKLDINVLSFGDEIENVTTLSVSNTKKKLYSDNVTPQQLLEQNNNNEQVKVATATTSTILGITTVTHMNDETQQLPDDVQIPPQHHELPVCRDDELLIQQSQSETNDDIKPVSKSLSAVEAHRAKYLSKKQKRDMATNNNVSSQQRRDDETLNKLLHFRRKIHDVTAQSKNETTTSTTAATGIMTQVQQLQQDDSLASRMARRAQQQAEEERRKYDINYKDNDPHSNPSYHGQVLHNDDDNDDDDIDPNKWMQTKFVCKKHMDHLSGDNKDAMEEYVVIDSHTHKKERKSSHKSR